MLEQSCVVWGSSMSQENKDDLERTQKCFAKLVLKEKYSDYRSALLQLGLETLEEGRTSLMARFAKSSIENGKLHNFFKERETTHPMELRDPDLYRTTKAHTERFRNSSILAMQRILNEKHREQK